MKALGESMALRQLAHRSRDRADGRAIRRRGGGKARIGNCSTVIRTVVGKHGAQLDGELVARLPQHGEAATLLLLLVDVLLVGGGVVDVPGRHLVIEADPQAEDIVDDANVGRATKRHQRIAGAVQRADIGAELVGVLAEARILQYVFDQAAHGAGPVQRALWAAQHLEPVKVIRQQIKNLVRRAAVPRAGTQRDFIDISADRSRLAHRGDAAQIDRSQTCLATIADVETGNVSGVIRQLFLPTLQQLFASLHANGAGHILNVNATFGGRYHHFFDYTGSEGGQGSRHQYAAHHGCQDGRAVTNGTFSCLAHGFLPPVDVLAVLSRDLHMPPTAAPGAWRNLGNRYSCRR